MAKVERVSESEWPFHVAVAGGKSVGGPSESLRCPGIGNILTQSRFRLGVVPSVTVRFSVTTSRVSPSPYVIHPLIIRLQRVFTAIHICRLSVVSLVVVV